MISFLSNAQKKPVSFKDSLDGKFDVSDYIIEANGFVPIPYIITEPALGGFGFAVAPVFIKRNPPYIDTIRGQVKRTPVAPNITGGVVAYTLNNTWLASAFRSGTLVKRRIKYVIGGAYANINMSYFRNTPQEEDKEFAFNFKTIVGFLQATKRISFSNWYAGFKYLFLNTDVRYKGTLPDFVKSQEVHSTVSQFGLVLELDNRDNVFTPNKGVKVHLDGNISANFLGSDYEYYRLNYYMYAYAQFSKKFVGGWRLDGQQAFQDPPFYLLPYIDMRGVPASRYQGQADILTELEGRWDVVPRWSIVFFGGTGKAFDEWNEFGSAKWIVSGGTGFRYMLARKFGLRVGIDLARGPETWAYYIVFGSNWLK
ncbi:MAG: hypothetical protein C5B52_15320 [Bacteroidetes bacterium]|nr:MAG: hypothetical protein C5B52_15320 [Bacteroidota bacterium]